MEAEELLKFKGIEAKKGGSMGSWLFGGGDDDSAAAKDAVAAADTDDTIHIFSVASGHLYERFLRIMMLSVRKNTEAPVKFWFIKNFLSPKFKVG